MVNIKNKKEEIDYLIKRFDELCDTQPSQVVLDINQYEQGHSRKVLKEYGRFVAQFELFYDLIVEMIHALNYVKKSKWPKHRSIQFMLMAYNLKPLYSSFDRLIEGFYEDCIILARPVYEAFIKTIYITCHPKNPYSVVIGKKFNLTNFLKHELKLNWHEYRLFSAMTHANAYCVLDEAMQISQEGQKEPITLKFKFDKKLFEVGVNVTSFLLLVYLKVIIDLLITNCNEVLKKEMVEKAKELIVLREKSFSLNQKDYWPQVIQDTKDIFKMIQETEVGKDWRKSWGSIRGFKDNLPIKSVGQN